MEYIVFGKDVSEMETIHEGDNCSLGKYEDEGILYFVVENNGDIEEFTNEQLAVESYMVASGIEVQV